MKRISVVLAIFLIVALIGGALYWYFVLSKEPAPKTTPKTETQSNTAKLCAAITTFETIKYEISCEKAVSLALQKVALQKAQGEVQKVSIGSVQARIPGSDPPKRGDIEMWLIDVKFQQPYFDEDFKREVKLMRIGIGLHQHFGVYRKVLE